jgi:hypothetical protein
VVCSHKPPTVIVPEQPHLCRLGPLGRLKDIKDLKDRKLKKVTAAEKIALMVAESCGRGCAERSEAQQPATLGADSKTGAEACSTAALQKNLTCVL